MQTEHLIFNHCCQRQQVKQICEILPNIRISILSQAFIIKAIDLCDLSGFVVASKDSDSILEPDLETDE
jgi:hypothetical protein